MGSIFGMCDRDIPSAFHFLSDEFGFKGPERTLYEGPKGCLYYSYSNATTGIMVGYDNECSSFNLFLSRQDTDGNPVMEGASDADNTCRLEWVLEVLNPAEAVRYEKTHFIQAQITLSSALLKQECADILRGDFSVFQRVKKHRENKELIDRWSKWFKRKYPVYIVCGSEVTPKANQEADHTCTCTICKKELHVELPFHKILIDHRTALPICEECLKGYRPKEPRIMLDAFDTSIVAKGSPNLNHCRRYIPSSFHFLVEEFGFHPPRLLSSLDPIGTLKVTTFKLGDLKLTNIGAPEGSLFYEYGGKAAAVLIGYSPMGGFQVRLGRAANGNNPDWFALDAKTCLLTDLLDVQDPDAAYQVRGSTCTTINSINASERHLPDKGAAILEGDFRLFDQVFDLLSGTGNRSFLSILPEESRMYVLCSGAEEWSTHIMPCSSCQTKLEIAQASSRTWIHRKNAMPLCWNCFEKRPKVKDPVKMGFDNILTWADSNVHSGE